MLIDIQNFLTCVYGFHTKANDNIRKRSEVEQFCFNTYQLEIFNFHQEDSFMRSVNYR